MNFHDTKMGQEFYGRTLPKIAEALKLIAKKLNTPAPAVSLPSEVPANFLSELYLGNYDPSDEPDTEEVARCIAEIMAKEDTLRAIVSPDIWEQIDHILSLVNKKVDRQLEQAFAAGFRSAMMMVMAGLTRTGSGKAA